MKNLSILKYALLSFIVSAFALHADEDQSAAEHIMRRAYTSIAEVEEGKIFLKPEKLSLKQGIIYVEDIEGAKFAIPIVFSSKGRPHVQVSESVVFNSWKCECGAWNHKWDNPTRCWRCDRLR